MSTIEMSTIEKIQNNEAYKQILADSFGGVMYNVDNRDKYDTDELLGLWDSLTPAQQDATGGIMKGVFNFLKETE